MRIAIVNDLPLAVEAMRRVLVADGRHTIAWIARDGAEAVSRAVADTPDLVLMDLIMPVMDGVEATRRIMAGAPCAILVVTATVEGNVTRVYEALGAGALDAVQTPGFGVGGAMLMVKLDQLGKRIKGRETVSPFLNTTAVSAVAANGSASGLKPVPASWLGGIGASAGGPAALAKVLGGIPADFPGALVVVQHIDDAFSAGLISWLGTQCKLKVKAAVDGDVPAPGVVYVAVGDHHLIVDTAGRLARTDVPRDCIYLPSIDVFFQSMAINWKKPGCGTLLTGMGRDGAIGLREMREAGFATLTQDRASSAVYGMPKAAAELGAATHILPLDAVSTQLRLLANNPVTPVPARR